jgi:hypothetical protein
MFFHKNFDSPCMPVATCQELTMIRKLFAVMSAFPAVALGQDKAADTGPVSQYRVQAIEKCEAAIVKLEELDRSHADSRDAFLFIGSSSIRRWNDLDSDMSPRKTNNRGY